MMMTPTTTVKTNTDREDIGGFIIVACPCREGEGEDLRLVVGVHDGDMLVLVSARSSYLCWWWWCFDVFLLFLNFLLLGTVVVVVVW